MYDGNFNIVLQKRFQITLKLYIYAAIMIAIIMFLVLIAVPINKWLSAAAEIQMKNIQIQELEIDRQKFLLQKEIEKQGALPEKVVIEEVVVKEIEPSRLSTVFYNWIVPIFGLCAMALGVAWVIFLLYDRFGARLIGRSQTTLSVLSASGSIAGMVFAAIKYQSELLQHEVGAYLFLSCLYALIFFALLLSTKVKILSIAIYITLLIVTVLVGWFTAGSPMAVLNEYQILLSDLNIPRQTLIVLGTVLPVMLVTSSLFLKPDNTVTTAL